MNGLEWLIQERKLDATLLACIGVQRVEHQAIGEAAVLPYVRDGRRYAAKFRAVAAKDWRATTGVSRGLFNEDVLIEGTDPVVLTEGEIDALSVIQSGYSRAVSLPDGWTEEGGKREVLVAEEKRLRAAPCVIVAGDDDPAGASLPRTVANILRGHDVRYATWSEGCKDANDVLVRFGEAELARCLATAKQIDPPDGFITGLSDLPPLAERRVLRIGKTPFNHVLAFEVGALSVVTGTPGAGKSTFMTFVAHELVLHEDIRVGLLCFESHPHQIRDQLARLRTGSPWAELDAGRQKTTASDLDRSFRIVHRTFDGGAHHLGWLEDMIYALAVRDGCKFILVDPWNELEHLPQPAESMTSYINFALQQIRLWAERFETHICVVAHPRKMPTEGTPRPPVGYDISDSAAFANKPSLGVTVHQDEAADGSPCVRIITWKVRDTQLYGFEKGQVRVRFNKQAMRYGPVDGGK